MLTPENLLVLATHGTYSYPELLRPYLHPKFDQRLQRNFSDVGTSVLVKGINPDQCLVPEHGRIAGDPARAEDAKDLFRMHDFGGVQVYNGLLPDSVRNACLDASHRPYHAEITRQILAVRGDTRNLLVIFDIHDTGNLILAVDPSNDRHRAERRSHPEITMDDGWHMPPVIISDNDGKTAPSQLMQDLANAFRTEFRLGDGDVRTNWHFKGGHVTKTYGDPAIPALAAAQQGRAVVQVELGRYLYIDERSQEIVPCAAKFFGERLATVLAEVAGGYTHRAKP